MAAALLLAGAVELKDTLPTLGEDGLTQALRQSVWDQALGDRSKPVAWPWEDLSVSMSLAPTASVPRLGLSAAMRLETAANETAPAPVKHPKAVAQKPAIEGDVALGDVALGDVSQADVTIGGSITFTAADGATCIYRVTGRRVVDPHLAASEAERFDGEAAMFECGPLESLIMQATQGEQKPAPLPAEEQRKL